ncbi:MAG: hypothetical protein VKP72_05650 [bacterium]|nr:hypothetical protein [bacterium]
MTCLHGHPSKLAPRTIELELPHPRGLARFEGVPALVCPACGFVAIERATSRAIDGWMERLGREAA